MKEVRKMKWKELQNVQFEEKRKTKKCNIGVKSSAKEDWGLKKSLMVNGMEWVVPLEEDVAQLCSQFVNRN